MLCSLLLAHSMRIHSTDDAKLPSIVESMILARGFTAWDPGAGDEFNYKHPDIAGLFIDLHFLADYNKTPYSALAGFDSMSQRPPRDATVLRPHSGIRLGLGVGGHRYNPSSFGEDVLAVSQNVSVRVQTGRKITRQKGSVPLASGGIENEAEFVEGLARWTLALLEAEKSTSTTTSLSGTTYSAKRDTYGRTHISLSTWAGSRSYPVIMNAAEGRALIKSPKGDVIVALGAPEVKIGDKWHQIDGIVLADGNKILIPMQIVDLID